METEIPATEPYQDFLFAMNRLGRGILQGCGETDVEVKTMRGLKRMVRHGPYAINAGW